MPDLEIRRAVGGNRREGRRSLSAYGSHARGERSAVAGSLWNGSRPSRTVARAPSGALEAGVFSAGAALALVYPLVARARGAARNSAKGQERAAGQPRSEEPSGMKRQPSIRSLETVSIEEATAYLEHARGDELDAASALAWDRNRLDGSNAAPDDAEVHHALFLLRRARGQLPPSFDEMRVELRRRVAA
jgi:hypothetical protein